MFIGKSFPFMALIISFRLVDYYNLPTNHPAVMVPQCVTCHKSSPGLTESLSKILNGFQPGCDGEEPKDSLCGGLRLLTAKKFQTVGVSLAVLVELYI